MSIELTPGVVVTVDPPALPDLVAAPPSSSTVAVLPVTGPTGPQGPEGPVGSGVNWYSGQGPPGLVIGAAAGDLYLDTVSGILYRLT